LIPQRLIAEDTEKWRKVIRAANIKPDQPWEPSIIGHKVAA
jgi:hypothetical protein